MLLILNTILNTTIALNTILILNILRVRVLNTNMIPILIRILIYGVAVVGCWKNVSFPTRMHWIITVKPSTRQFLGPRLSRPSPGCPRRWSDHQGNTAADCAERRIRKSRSEDDNDTDNGDLIQKPNQKSVETLLLLPKNPR
jgi:hypothetical protein